MAEDEIGKVARSTAQSGKVDYSQSIVLHESTRSRVELVAYYIERSSGATELSVKITTHIKKPPPQDWVIDETRSLSLNDAAARRLHRALAERFAVAAEGVGTFLTIPVSGAKADLRGHDPNQVAQALSTALAQPEILGHLSGLDLSSELAGALRGAVRISDMRAALSQLRHLLDTGVVGEQKYQEWCEKHSWAFGNAYVMRDEVRSVAAGDDLYPSGQPVLSRHLS